MVIDEGCTPTHCGGGSTCGAYADVIRRRGPLPTSTVMGACVAADAMRERCVTEPNRTGTRTRFVNSVHSAGHRRTGARGLFARLVRLRTPLQGAHFS